MEFPEEDGKKGRPEYYSEEAILTFLTIRSVFYLPLRAAEGFMSSLTSILLSKAVREIVIDSTGLKVYGVGEWKARQDGESKRRTWRKLHLGVCPQSNTIVAESLIINSVSDCQVYPRLVSALPQSVDRIYADGAYEKKSCYEAVYNNEITLIVPSRRNAVVRKNSLPELSPRNQTCESIRSLGDGEAGLKAWKEEIGYHKRSLAETAMYRFKQLFDDKICRRALERQQTEVKVKCMIFNEMTSLGMPESERIAS